MTEPWQRRLHAGLDELDIAFDDRSLARLQALLLLLHKWNRAYNLTAVRTLDDMVIKHLLDSASVAKAVRGPRLLDVGAGPGLPGLVLAILKPDVAVTLLDSNGKKVRFQRQAILELELANVTAVQARVENYRAPGFDQIVSRAFASLADFVAWTAHLLAPQGQWLAMKGRLDERELAELPDTVVLAERCLLAVPGDAASRHLVTLRRAG
jgi:16S rRNA (guanine527-N7)-methyltransferase